MHNTGCPVFSNFFQEPLIGTYIPQLLMTNDSFSSQTWAIYVPNRNSEIKSILWPTGPLREVKIGYIGNIPPFSFKLIPSIQIAWLPGVIKTSSRTVLETF